MGAIISEWQISTKGELTELYERYNLAQEELAGLKRFEHEASDRINALEQRIKILKEKQK
jgi:hypothetical protein